MANLGFYGTDAHGRVVAIDVFQRLELHPVTDHGSGTMGFDIINVPGRYIGSDIFKTTLKGHGLPLFTGRGNGLALAVRTGPHALDRAVDAIIVPQGILHAF